MSEPRDPHRSDISGQDARQGEIILDTRPKRWIFIAGLVVVVAVALLLRLLVWH
jgi:hypothetical protein